MNLRGTHPLKQLLKSGETVQWQERVHQHTLDHVIDSCVLGLVMDVVQKLLPQTSLGKLFFLDLVFQGMRVRGQAGHVKD